MFADGTPFAFSTLDGDYFPDGTLTLQAVSLPIIGPASINASSQPVPLGIRQGQTLTVAAGGIVGRSFNAAAGSTVHVSSGGVVGDNFEAVGATVTVDGGVVGDAADMFGGSVFNLTGGSIGNRFESFAGSTVNVNGGKIGDDFRVRKGSIANISGGAVGVGFYVTESGTAQISGGTFGDYLGAESGATVTITGGNFGEGIDFASGANVSISGGTFGDAISNHTSYNTTDIYGGDFRFDGQPISALASIGSQATLAGYSYSAGVISGVFADGTQFAISGGNFGALFHTVALPSVGAAILKASTDSIPLGIRGGQTLFVDAPGVVGRNFNAGRGSVVEIQSTGDVGKSFRSIGAVVVMAGGTIGQQMSAFDGSSISIFGGTVGDGFHADNGSSVQLAGGSIGNGFGASRHSTLTISGGTLGTDAIIGNGSRLNISNGSIGNFLEIDTFGELNMTGGTLDFETLVAGQATISGGRIGDFFTAYQGANVKLSGGSFGDNFVAAGGSNVLQNGTDFRVNGVQVWGGNGVRIPVDVPAGAVISGVFADGSPFAFSAGDQDGLDGAFSLQETLVGSPGQYDFRASTDHLPTGLRNFQTLTVDAGGVVPDNFVAGYGSVVHVQPGGMVGANLEVVGAYMDMTGGSVGERFDAMDGAMVNISGGTIGSDVDIVRATVNVTGGMLSYGAKLKSGSTLNVSGGSIGDVTASSGANLNLSNGTIGSAVVSSSTVSITGGNITGNLTFDTGATGTVSGGTITGAVGLNKGCRISISGGQFNSTLSPDLQSTANITGGTLSKGLTTRGLVNVSGNPLVGGFTVGTAGDLKIAGGTFTGARRLMASGEVDLYGTQFLLNNVPVSGLALNQPSTLTTRGGMTLSGLLASGAPFSFVLNFTNPQSNDFFSTTGKLTLTLMLPGDFNHNGIVDAADYTVWRNALGQSVANGSGADGNFDGVVDGLDYGVWQNNFGHKLSGSGSGAGGNVAVPEPSSVFLAAAATLAVLLFRRNAG